MHAVGIPAVLPHLGHSRTAAQDGVDGEHRLDGMVAQRSKRDTLTTRGLRDPRTKGAIERRPHTRRNESFWLRGGNRV